MSDSFLEVTAPFDGAKIARLPRQNAAEMERRWPPPMACTATAMAGCPRRGASKFYEQRQKSLPDAPKNWRCRRRAKAASR